MEKTHRLQAQGSIFLMAAIVLIVLFLPNISAFEFDNTKTYNDATKTVTIKNSFWIGIPLLKLDTIAEIKLNTPQVYLVMPGKDRLVAEFTINNYADKYSNIIDNIDLYDINNNMNKFNREITYKYKSVTKEKYTYWILNCTDSTMKFCNSIEVEDFRDKIEWLEFDPKQELPPGEITIGLFTDVDKDDNVEWVPTLFSVRINEWSQWTSALSVGLRGYWELDNRLDVFRLNNLSENTNQGGTFTYRDGKLINNAAFLSMGENNNSLNLTVTARANLTRNFTINLWGNTTGYTNVRKQLFIDSDAAFGVFVNSTNIVTEQASGTILCMMNQTMVGSNWYMFTIDVNDTDVTTYINGTQRCKIARSYNTIGKDVRFGCSASSDSYHWGGDVDEIGLWNRSLSTTEITDLYNDGKAIKYDAYPGQLVINITLDYPLNNSDLGINTTLITGATFFSNNNLTNATLYVWNLSHSVTGTNFTVINTTDDTANLSLSGLGIGNYSWNYYGCSINSTATNCSWAPKNLSFYISGILINSETYNVSSFETTYETFEINVTTIHLGTATSTLYYNGTAYSGTQVGIDNESRFYATVNIPSITAPANKSFYWKIEFANSTKVSETHNSSVEQLLFDLCNSTMNTNKYINFTFADEDNGTVLDARVTASTFTYSGSSGAINKTKTYSNTPYNRSYSFCSNYNRTISNDLTFSYSAAGYVQRTYNPASLDLTTNTLNQTLYLLSTADGQYVTFQVVNTAGQTISGAIINITKDISGTPTLIFSDTTDAAGLVTFWLNPNFEHDINVSATGYDTYSTSITPTQTSYTITLGGETTSSEDCSKGMDYIIKPTGDTLSNETHYVFNFTLSSSFWDVDTFGFELKNGSGTSLGSTSSTDNGGMLTLNRSTGNHTRLVMNYYWNVSGVTTCTNGTKYWSIYNEEYDSDWSIKNFFDDFSTYASSGMFGLNATSLAILAFIIILLFTGVMSYKFGLNSPAVIATLFFVLVLFFDTVIDFIPDLNGKPIATIMSFAFMLAIWIREVFGQ